MRIRNRTARWLSGPIGGKGDSATVFTKPPLREGYPTTQPAEAFPYRRLDNLERRLDQITEALRDAGLIRYVPEHWEVHTALKGLRRRPGDRGPEVAEEQCRDERQGGQVAQQA